MDRTFRKTCAKLHLWLGLLSEIVVLIICITDCLYAFKNEIIDAIQPWHSIDPQKEEFLLPSRILAITDSIMEGASAATVTYGGESDAVWVDYYRPEMGISTVFIDPYDGRVLKSVIKRSGDFDFLRFVLGEHRTLWLPREIGSPIVGYSVLVFLITLIMGIVLWWSRRWTRGALVQRLTMKRPCTFPKLNFDLHNTVDFYASSLLSTLCFTGLILSLNWFSKVVYGIASGSGELRPYVLPLSDTLQVGSRVEAPLGLLYMRLHSEEPATEVFCLALPGQADGVFRISVVHERGSYYRTDNLFFDQYTLVPLKGSDPYIGKYTGASATDKFRHMDLETHDGRIQGLPGKILMFFASLISVSLPLTGFIIWYRRHRKK